MSFLVCQNDKDIPVPIKTSYLYHRRMEKIIIVKKIITKLINKTIFQLCANIIIFYVAQFINIEQ